jgi:23S rRNA pseudouridine1911/1915/1917 synthase
VHGFVRSDGEVDAPVGRDPRNRLRMSVTDTGKVARTHYRVLERFPGATLLECSLDTGRTHQIRVHMQSIGHPLVGDPVYRAGRPALAAGPLGSFGRQALHAAHLQFVHPDSGELVAFDAPLPGDFFALLEGLREKSDD